MYHYINKNNAPQGHYSLKEILWQHGQWVVLKCYKAMCINEEMQKFLKILGNCLQSVIQTRGVKSSYKPKMTKKDPLCSAIVFQRKTAIWIFSCAIACFSMVPKTFSQEALSQANQEKMSEAQFAINKELRDRENEIQRVRNEIAKVDDMLNSTDSSSEQFSKLQKKRRDLIQQFQALEDEMEIHKKLRSKTMQEMEQRFKKDEARSIAAKNVPSRSEMFRIKLEELKSEYGVGPSGAIQYIDFDRKGGGGYTPDYYCIWPFRNNLWVKLIGNTMGPNGLELSMIIFWPVPENVKFSNTGFFTGGEKHTLTIEINNLKELMSAIEKYQDWDKRITEEKIAYKFSKDLTENYVFVSNGEEAFIAGKNELMDRVDLELIGRKEHIDDIKFVIENIPQILTSLDRALKQRNASKKTMQEKLDSILK